LPAIVNVQVLVLVAPLQHAPDQITSRSFVARSVIDVPPLKLAEPVHEHIDVRGVGVTRSPLRPATVIAS
jgi:hypothetical protein